MFWDTFYKICLAKGVTPNHVCKEIGLSNATATGWKNGTLPKADILCKISDYLDVSVDELLGRKETAPAHFESRSDLEKVLGNLSEPEIDEWIRYGQYLLYQKNAEK